MFRGYEVGAVDYLMKPVVPEVLKSKVAVFVELFRKSERLRESEDKLRRLAAHLITCQGRGTRAHRARDPRRARPGAHRPEDGGHLARQAPEGAAADREDRLDVRADRLHGADGAQDRHRPAPRDARRHGPGGRGRLAGEGVPEAHRHPLPRQAAAGDASSTSTSRPRCSASSRRSSPTWRATRAPRASTSSSRSATTEVSLEVLDNGVGIQDDELHAQEVARPARHAGARAALRRRRPHHRLARARHAGVGDHPTSGNPK